MGHKLKTMRNDDYPLEALFGRILSPFERFLKRTTAGGIVLMVTSAAALIIANTRWGASFHHTWEQPFRFAIAAWKLELSLHVLVNDGLMAFFFLLVGLELKREILVGELSSWRDAALPVFAAFGGMVCPGIIYLSLNPSDPGVSGWGIPMATDIAFSVGILVLLAWRIPSNLIIFLMAMAIADDLGAVLIIALFYSHGVNTYALGAAAGTLALLVLLNRGGIRHSLPYAIAGLFLWVFLLDSGIHATVAGILLALTIPAKPIYRPVAFEKRVSQLLGKFHEETTNLETPDQPLSNPRMATIAENLEKAAKAVQSPLQHMEHTLSPWVTFVVIPLFALSNVGIDFSAIQLGDSLRHPVTLGVILGLVVGKFLGIVGLSWIALRIGLGRLPEGVRWRHLMGVGWLGGIGFTMSLFISQLAFDQPSLMEQAKLGILAGSTLSAILGLIWLYAGQSSRQKA